MSYVGSKSQVGAGAVLWIATSATPIGEILDIARSGAKMGTEDSTNLQSLSDEFIKSLLAPGGVKITVNRVAADAGQALVETDFNAGTIGPFGITLPKTAAQTTTGDSFAFSALIEEFDDISKITAKGKVTSDISLKIQGGASATPWVRTAGA